MSDVLSQRARSWCFTHNNYDASSESYYVSLVCEHIVYGREVGAGGTRHLQGFVRFRHQKFGRAVSLLLPGCHISVARDLLAAIAYCRKDGDVYERGTTIEAHVAGGRATAEKWALARSHAQAGEFESIPAEFHFKYASAMKRIRLEYLGAQVPASIPVLNNHWFHGRSGCGKSSYARLLYPGAYIKMRNKWWDNYEFQSVVIVDDVDPNMELWLSAFLKDWADHHAFRAEVKGSSVMVRPSVLVVTSQYTIAECFKDPRTVEALSRRFNSRELFADGGHIVFDDRGVPALPPVLLADAQAVVVAALPQSAVVAERISGDHYP